MTLLLITNAVAYFLVSRYSQVSMYAGDEYQKAKARYKKSGHGSIPHPFFGLSSGGGGTFDNDLSDEPLFDSVFSHQQPHEIKVLVLGGSVATHLSNKEVSGETDQLAQQLNRLFETDRFAVYNAAIRGGKQPQQYFKYLYLDLLGFRPDIVINLDGFNEIALPLSENLALGNPAIFPRSYSRLLHAATSDRSCAEFNNRLVSSHSNIPLVELISWVYIGNCDRNIQDNRIDSPWWSSLLIVHKDTDYVSQSIAIWRESSNRLQDALAARNIDYIHVLQPNQYLEGSKTLSAEEKATVLSYPIYGEPIRKYYSQLNESGLNVKHFRDQRLIFRTVAETLYVDNCCHLNKRGMELIIDDLVVHNRQVFEKHLNVR